MPDQKDSNPNVSRRRFMRTSVLAGTALGLNAAVAGSTAGSAPATPLKKARRPGKSFTGKRPEDYRVVLQDIGDPLLRMPWPPSPEGLVEGSIGALKDSAVNMYAFGINHAGGTTHCSKLYPIIGEEQPLLKSGNTLRMMQAVQRLCEAGHDPLTLMCDGGHQAGLDVFLRLRMNDHHDRWGDRIGLDKPSRLPKDHPAEPYFYTPKWKREHPEWLIGDRHAPHPDTSFEYMQSSAGNYAIGPYRDLIFNLAAETLTQYDLDGFELDFFRSPFLFPIYEAYVQRHVMTELIRRIRRVADEQAAKRGRPIFLSARVPATVDLCLRIGIDLPVWFEEGLLDMVVVSNGLSPFSTPWTELSQLGAKHGIPALACFTHARPTREGRESLRAATHRAFSSGITGIQFWNYFYRMPHYHRPGENPLDLSFTHDLVDPDLVKNGPKKYLLDGSPHTGSILTGTFGHAEWPGQTPMMIGLSTDGIGHKVAFDIADDLSRSKPQGSPRAWVRIVDLGPEDRLEFAWNGKPIQPDPKAFAGITLKDSHEFEFELDPAEVRPGENHLEIKLLERHARLEPYVTLVDGRLSIPELKGA